MPVFLFTFLKESLIYVVQPLLFQRMGQRPHHVLLDGRDDLLRHHQVRAVADQRVHLAERVHGTFERSFRLPKGLAPETLAVVSDDVRRNGPASAGEAARRLGMSRVAVRRYLEHLTAEGRVIRSPRYGTGGRPESEYRWNAE